LIFIFQANQWSPGGGFRAGSGAQEENLHRRSCLHHFLENSDKLVKRNWKYPLPSVGGLYVPNVPFCRSSEQTGYAWLEKPVKLKKSFSLFMIYL